MYKVEQGDPPPIVITLSGDLAARLAGMLNHTTAVYSVDDKEHEFLHFADALCDLVGRDKWGMYFESYAAAMRNVK